MNRHTTPRPRGAIAAALALAACGGGDPMPIPTTSSPRAAVDPCDGTTEHALAGQYAGEILYDATERGGAMCLWTARATLVASGDSGVACELAMLLDAPVEQPVVPAEDAAFAGACLPAEAVSADLIVEADGSLSVFAPSLDPESTTYPGVSGGPLVRAISLVSTLVPLVDSFAVDGDALVPMRLREINDETLAGLLERVE